MTDEWVLFAYLFTAVPLFCLDTVLNNIIDPAPGRNVCVWYKYGWWHYHSAALFGHIEITRFIPFLLWWESSFHSRGWSLLHQTLVPSMYFRRPGHRITVLWCFPVQTRRSSVRSLITDQSVRRIFIKLTAYLMYQFLCGCHGMPA